MGKKGFTYIELIVVLAILAILASIAIPTIRGYQTKAHNTAAISDLKNVKNMLELYHHEHGCYP